MVVMCKKTVVSKHLWAWRNSSERFHEIILRFQHVWSLLLFSLCWAFVCLSLRTYFSRVCSELSSFWSFPYPDGEALVFFYRSKIGFSDPNLWNIATVSFFCCSFLCRFSNSSLGIWMVASDSQKSLIDQKWSRNVHTNVTNENVWKRWENPPCPEKKREMMTRVLTVNPDAKLLRDILHISGLRGRRPHGLNQGDKFSTFQRSFEKFRDPTRLEPLNKICVFYIISAIFWHHIFYTYENKATTIWNCFMIHPHPLDVFFLTVATQKPVQRGTTTRRNEAPTNKPFTPSATSSSLPNDDFRFFSAILQGFGVIQSQIQVQKKNYKALYKD